jgi:hypothetical protein
MFCLTKRQQTLERKQAALRAVLVTLEEQDTSQPADGPAMLTTFKSHYTGPLPRVSDKRLAKGLVKLAEHKKRDEFVRKLEKRNTEIERKLSRSSSVSEKGSVSGSSVGRSESSSTLVESSDEEKEKEEAEKEGAPLELTWTWSALGEAF